MPNAEKLAKKNKYFDKLVNLCVDTPNALLVGVDHVASKQMQDIRMELRGKATFASTLQTRSSWVLIMSHPSRCRTFVWSFVVRPSCSWARIL